MTRCPRHDVPFVGDRDGAGGEDVWCPLCDEPQEDQTEETIHA